MMGLLAVAELTVKLEFTVPPSGLVKVTARGPVAAALSMLTLIFNCIELRSVIELVMPVPKFAVMLGWKPVPVTVRGRVVP